LGDGGFGLGLGGNVGGSCGSLWEQFHALVKLKVDTVYVAMFDEVDEGTAIFKVTSSPPTQGHFVGCEGLPSDWYLRLVGEGARMLRGQRPLTADIPIKP